MRQKIGHDGFFQIEGTNKSASYFLIARGQTEALIPAGEVVDLHVDDSKFNMIFSLSITRPARAPTENNDERHTDFGRIVLSASAKNHGTVMLTGARIRSLQVGGAFSGRLLVENSWIRDMQLFRSADIVPNISITGSRIAKLWLQPSCCGLLQLNGTVLGRIHCSPADLPSPITGALIVTGRSKLCVNPEKLNSPELEHYRYLQVHMSRALNERVQAHVATYREKSNAQA